MPRKNKPNINIKNVAGNVVISQDQQGGVTSHQNIQNSQDGNSPKKKSIFTNRYLFWIGFFASILTILAYFGLQPKVIKNETKVLPEIDSSQSKSILSSSPINQPLSNKILSSTDSTKLEKNKPKKKTMWNNKDKGGTPITIGDVNGDVVVSQNQSGGITAHTVIQNNFGRQEPASRHLSTNDMVRLDSLNKNYKIAVWISLKNTEANAYGQELYMYLKSKGYNLLELNGYQTGIGGSDKRFDITPNDQSYSIFVPIQE